ncbi:hypothetical protein [Parabacteroides provencensis]|uniref:hypothetical protein n=1 Tax=Parabacteroides provencensis TaxID=1944636 RepID=UPI000C15D34C|nr:hypothetical protein [Parabacteroides provencensis]
MSGANQQQEKRKEFEKLMLTGKYTQKEIAAMIDVSEQSLSKWAKSMPVTQYMRIRKNIADHLEKLSESPKGNEEMIFRFVEKLTEIDILIRKAKYLPRI